MPRLTPAHYEAMALFNELAASKELRLEMILQPGDIQLLNNHTCLHYRSAFVDYPVCRAPFRMHCSSGCFPIDALCAHAAAVRAIFWLGGKRKCPSTCSIIWRAW